jgi:hypothetical protein
MAINQHLTSLIRLIISRDGPPLLRLQCRELSKCVSLHFWEAFRCVLKTLCLVNIYFRNINAIVPISSERNQYSKRTLK